MAITSVDVVVLVGSSDIDHIRRCVKALEQHNPPSDIITTRYIFVTYGAASLAVAEYVNFLCASRHHFICSDTGLSGAQGRVSGLNKGLSIAKSLYNPASLYVVLESDVVVSSYWLDDMCDVLLNSNDTIFALGPVSNDAGYQSLFYTPQELLYWSHAHAPTSLAPGVSPESIARLVRNVSAHTAYFTPLLHGFCVLLKASTLQRIGFWDEIHFPMGYGDDYDISLRARAAGYQMMVVPWVYIHRQAIHHDTSRDIIESSSQYLLLRYDSALNEVSKWFQRDASLVPLRSAVQNHLHLMGEMYSPPIMSQSILFLCFIGHSALDTIINQVVALNRLGSESALSVPVSSVYPNTKESILSKYPALKPTSLIVHGGNVQFPFAISQDIIDISASYDVVVATSGLVVEALKMIFAVHSHILPVFMIYDYEPWVVEYNNNKCMLSPSAKLRNHMIHTIANNQFTRFVYGSWIHEIVRDEMQHALPVQVIDIGVSNDFLVSRETWYKKEQKSFSLNGRGDKFFFVADIHARIGLASQLNVLDIALRLVHSYGEIIHVTLLGCSNVEVVRLFHNLIAREQELGYTSSHLMLRYVMLQQYLDCKSDMSIGDQILLFRRADVYFDMSTWSRGNYALDAMASGCLVILPTTGICNELCITHGACLCYDPADTVGYFVNLVLALLDSFTRSSILKKSRVFVDKYNSAYMSSEILYKVWQIRHRY